MQLVPKLTLAFIVSFSRHHHSFPCPSASTLVGVGWLPGGGDLVLHPKGSEPSRPCPYWAALAIIACSPTRSIEPLSFSCSPSCSHQIATLALRGNQSQLSPLPVICLLVHWHRIPEGPGSRCCFKFTRPIRSFSPLPYRSQASNTIDIRLYVQEAPNVGQVVGGVNPTSASCFLNPCRTTNEEATLVITHWPAPLHYLAPQPHRVLSSSWCRKQGFHRPFQCSRRRSD